jgi:hypothetical protein
VAISWKIGSRGGGGWISLRTFRGTNLRRETGKRGKLGKIDKEKWKKEEK